MGVNNDLSTLKEFTRSLKSELEKSNIAVEEEVLKKALDESWKSMQLLGDCSEGCTNGAHW